MSALVVTVASLVIASASASDPFVLLASENQIDVAGAVTPRAKAIVDIPAVHDLSVTATFVVSPNWSEAYVGPTWSPKKSISLGIAGGIESADAPWRVMAYSSISNKKLSFLGIAEYGGSGPWYKVSASYKAEPVTIGVLAQRFDGIGPRIGYSLSRPSLDVWAAPLYDLESRSPKALVGFSWIPRL
ncbi:MAG: hypothetical protein WCT28_00495 [Patescibacteria group bacterium]|jgi:hypothetical protein